MIRRIYALRGSRPTVPVHMRYEWIYLYAYVCPASGETFWLILPTVTTELMNLSLHEFAKHAGITSTNQVVLVVDQAGFHTAKDLIIPPGMHLVFLPSHTPELQPAERLWSLTDEPLVNVCFNSLQKLTDTLATRCKNLTQLKDTISSLCNYDWIERIHKKNNILGN